MIKEKPSLRRVSSTGVEWGGGANGANSFILKLTSTEKGANKENGSVASPGSLSIHPKLSPC